MAGSFEWMRQPLFVEVFQFVLYIGFLIFYSAVAFDAIGRLITLIRPQWWVGASVLAAARERMWTFGAPYLGWVVLSALFIAIATGNAETLLRFPPTGSVNREWAENFATLGLFLWLTSGFVRTGGLAVLYTGLTSGELVKLARLMQNGMLVLVGLVLLFPSLFWPGPFAVFGMLAAITSALILMFNGLVMAAVIRRTGAKQASAVRLSPAAGRPFAVLVSDIHFTADVQK